MKIILKTLRNYWRMILSSGEGEKIKDKFIILFYFFIQLPFNKVFRILRITKNRPRFIKEIYVNNKYGRFFCSNNYGIFTSIVEDYEKPLQKFSIEKGTFVDIGANVGVYTIRFANKLKENGQVIAIEPFKENYEILEKNIKLNNLGNVKLVKFVCSDVEKKIPFYINEGIGGHSIKIKSDNKIILKSKKLDTILRELEINNVNFIKIDVEGAESSVLKGALKILKNDKPNILFEAWGEKQLEDVKKILLNFN